MVQTVKFWVRVRLQKVMFIRVRVSSLSPANHCVILGSVITKGLIFEMAQIG